MAQGSIASEMVEHEARALLTRLDRLRPFSLYETMVLAAAPSPAALSGIEASLLAGQRNVRRRVRTFLTWLRGPGRGVPPSEQQKQLTVLRLQFNSVLSQLDLFAEVVTQRSERDNGPWLSGLDVVATDALRIGLPGVVPPPVVCYLARGPGAAIRRARTRLPGGAFNPVAIIRVPRERMVGHGIASSLVHEVGHQAAALLCLVESLRPVLARRVAESTNESERAAFRCWERWISEIVADLWSVGKLGIGSTLGLFGVVSLPRWAVFRPSGDDPHPVPWIRVLLSCTMGDALYPHPQWAGLAKVWRQLYPIDSVTDDYRRTLEGLVRSMPQFVNLLVDFRPKALRGWSLAEAMPLAERRPEQLLALLQRLRRLPTAGWVNVPPTLAFAVVGQGRAAGLIEPETEGRLLSELLTLWALRSTLDVTAICANPTVPALSRAS